MQASLYVRRGPQSGAVFPLYGTAITLIGRAASNHVVLRDASVSTNHCLIAPSREAEGFVLLDAHGRTELEVNRRPFTKGHVTLGDVVTVGAFELELVPADRPWPAPEPTLLTGRSATARALARKPDGFLEWFDFHDDPFVHTADPRYFYHSPCHWEAFTTLNRWIETGPPLAVLFGEHGSGKTFVTSCLARRLALISPRTVLVRPDREAARRNDLILEAVLAASAKVGGPAFEGSTPIEVWHALLGEVRRNRALFVFLIDDAHELSRDNLRRLTELLETPGLRDSARILLAGEEQLRDLVAVPPLADHLGVTCYLAPMPADDVAAYVLHRVRLASDEDRPLFTRRALEMLATYSGGIPRLINNVADAALCHAYRRDAHEVTPDLLAAALDELLHADS